MLVGKHILILEGDGIGPEIVREARKVLDLVNAKFNLGLTFENELIEKGFNHAFVAAFMNGERISIEKAIKLAEKK